MTVKNPVPVDDNGRSLQGYDPVVSKPAVPIISNTTLDPVTGVLYGNKNVISTRTSAVILNLGSLARATYSSGQLSGNGTYAILALDVNVTALTGGTTPTVTFKLSRVGADGVLYPIYTPAAISAAGVFSTTIGAGCVTNQDFGDTFQLDMVTTGAPTSITFSASIKGKS